jgi:hypothetical protein
MKETVAQSCLWGFALCLTVALVGVALVGQAVAGRPFISATDAKIVEAGFLELQTGIALSRNTRAGANESNWNLPSMVFNLGLTENFEVDLATGIDLVREKIEGSRRRQLGSVAETSLTAKSRLFKGEGAIPSLATELTLILPTQQRELLSAPSRKVGFTGVLVTTAEAGPLTYHLNLGGGVVESPRRGLGTVGSLLWALAGEMALGNNGLSAVLEFRGESIRGSLPDNTALGGLVWESPWGVKFDAAAFGGLSQGSDSWGITFGITYAFKALSWLAD